MQARRRSLGTPALVFTGRRVPSGRFRVVVRTRLGAVASWRA